MEEIEALQNRLWCKTRVCIDVNITLWKTYSKDGWLLRENATQKIEVGKSLESHEYWKGQEGIEKMGTALRM